MLVVPRKHLILFFILNNTFAGVKFTHLFSCDVFFLVFSERFASQIKSSNLTCFSNLFSLFGRYISETVTIQPSCNNMFFILILTIYCSIEIRSDGSYFNPSTVYFLR